MVSTSKDHDMPTIGTRVRLHPDRSSDHDRRVFGVGIVTAIRGEHFISPIIVAWDGLRRSDGTQISGWYEADQLVQADGDGQSW